MKDVVLLTPVLGDDLTFLYDNLKHCRTVKVARDLTALRLLECDPQPILIGYGTGDVVPAEVLVRFARAYNFHAASPDYPGRDPHHFAIYDGARNYGATAHVMTERVDEGAIVGVEQFEIPADCTPVKLLGLANDVMRVLFAKLAPKMLKDSSLPRIAGKAWAKQKTNRSQFKDMCAVSPLIGATEFDRRFAAFDGDIYDNLMVKLHGYNFRIDKSTKAKKVVDSRYNEFTENAYTAMLRQAKNIGYDFVNYGAQTEKMHVLWRHDIDFSVHRAMRLAEIEIDENVRSTWFINPHSSFYNIYEKSVQEKLHRIVAMGHWVGLHFDAGFYPNVNWAGTMMDSILKTEAELVGFVCGASVDVVSWHNPDSSGLLAVDDTRVGGLVNCYSAEIKARYQYVSDSNGYWRFKSIPELLKEEHERVQVLTHPGWWTPEPMAPRDRIERCLLGRARSVAEAYDAGLALHGRENIGR